jgi:predicted Abi (CAAX) family protease
MLAYLHRNLLAGYRTSPLRRAKVSLVFTAIFACLAAVGGLSGKLFQFHLVESQLLCLLPLSLFFFPAFLEESFFRGILIPNTIKEKGPSAIFAATLFSATTFTLWHPLNALTVNPGAQQLFLNPYFLGIVFALGITCSLSYIYSQSLWVPIVIHWLTVLIWVIFLGGRNLVLTS